MARIRSPQLVHKHKAIILVIVTVATDLLIEFLCLFHLQKVFPEAADQRQGTQTGLGLGGLLFNFHLLAIKSNRRHGSYDRNRSTLKVDGIPLQSQHFTPTESVKSGHQHRQLQLGSPKGFKHLLHLVRREKDRLKAVLSGPIHLVRHILHQHIGLDRIFQRRVDNRVIVDDRIRLYLSDHFGIKHLQVSGFQLPQGQISLAEVRPDWLLIAA